MSIHASLLQKSVSSTRSIKVSQTDFEEHLRRLSNDLITSRSLLKGLIEAIDSKDSEYFVNFVNLSRKFMEK